MNRKFHIITFFFVLGLFFIPSTSHSCEKKPVKTEKSCCKEKISDKKESKSCCDSTSTKDKDNSCNGTCGSSSCTTITSSVSFSLFVSNEIEFTINNLNFSTKKLKFYHSESLLSDGYSSIWLIPKIS